MNLKFSRIFVALLICVGMYFPTNAQSDDQLVADRIIAKVDDQIILESEVMALYQDFVSSGQIANQQTKCQILQRLVINKVMYVKAEIDSIVVDDAQVTGELDRRMGYFVAQIGSEEKIEEYYGKSINEFKEELRDQVHEQLVIQTMQGEITGGITVTPAEIRKYFKNIPRDSLPYYSTEVEVGQIVKKPDYNEKQVQIVEQKLYDLKKRIEAGESFEQLARLYSQDPGSARSGGDLGFRKRGELVPEFEGAAMTMDEGEVSDPIRSDFGYHLIQLLERRGNEFHARHILIKPLYEANDYNNAAKFLDSLRTEIVTDSVSFDKAAKEHSDDQQTAGAGGYFSDPVGGSLVSVENLDPEIFFSIDTMTIGSVSKPVMYKMPDGTQAMRIIYYKNKLKPHIANLRDDYLKIQQATLDSKNAEALEKWFKKAKEDVFIEIVPDYDNCDISL
ncbi:peptidylprolyl isomerase [Aureibacter tunicatorum]|uniref:Peptidyl-prolyl cis-trans isomerase SurA n=1 Tax=Aureibacter tunicatorum TaxID=866807 RepID=A0AAE3XRI6_9BACT|nr:peptidylprolyl isomerase [Aureibacter tunicatorum]MDR6240124.1 peptidyl-prolyl cis-trans isomerase SurA [Aureibacter tunicatorum]BDD05995.1 peptidylprolyl isomerase [Aureibacter tunicatorum]